MMFLLKTVDVNFPCKVDILVNGKRTWIKLYHVNCDQNRKRC